MKPRILELQTLVNNDACAEQVELFKQMFGNSVEITPELCVSVADKFDFTWAVRHLLSPAARADYERVRAPARAEYERAKESVRADYERVRAPAWAEYYERVRAPAWAEYERVKARAFGELFCKEDGR
jgi:cell division septum initiation protein DivIVA